MMPPRLLRLSRLLVLFLLVASPAPAQDTGIVQKLYDNALQLLRTGKPEEALKSFEQIYQSYGKSAQAADALFQAASYYYPTTELDDLGLASRDSIQKAIPLLDRIRREYGTSSRAPEALYRLGLLALEPENPRANPDEAYAAFTSVANVYPGSSLVGPALFGAAVSQMRSEAFGTAIEDFSRLLEQFPDLPAAPRARLAFGYCQFRAGDFPRAMEEYQKVRDFFPSRSEAKVALERLTLLHRLRLNPSVGRSVSYELDPTFPGKLQLLGAKSLVSMAVDPDGNLLVGDARGGGAIKVDPTGKVIGRLVLVDLQAVASDWRSNAALAGGGIILLGTRQFALARPDASSSRPVKDVGALAVDRDGRILVADTKAGEILLYGRDLNFKGSLHRTASGRLTAVQVSFDNQVYVLDSKEKSINVYSDGKLLSRLRLDEPPASIALPVDLAVDDLGDLYIVDDAASRVVVLDPTGKRVLSTLTSGKTKGGLADPQRVGVDRQGRIYVYDRKADAVLRFH
ncbi:MAG: tetratricopeptide repeat protein [Acidobacteria bacterium]|nr:tetratricopeptide repeat protein [Acidobacteriota bacterium]